MEDFEAKKPEMVALLKQLVERESPSNDKTALDRLGDFLAKTCLDAGAQVEMLPVVSTGDHLVARWGSGPGGILLMHHMDTVHPLGTLNRAPFYEKEDRIFGPGVADMKGGIVVSLAAITSLRASGRLHRPVTVLVTTDEETGSETSRELIIRLAREAVLALVLEPGMLDSSLKTWRKGVGEFKLKVLGRAAHAGSSHQDGLNAIQELANQVLAIQKMTDYDKGTTLNVGVIRGGTVTNVVPEQAEAEVDFRVLIPQEAERVEQAFKALKPVIPGTSLEVTGGLNRPPMPRDDLMKATFEKARRIAGSIGLQIKAGGTGGASDGNFVAPLGIPLLDGLGPYGDGMHSDREYIFTRSLTERTALLAALIEQW
ncbi:MAG TPA: M20 family metallopeptidase [Anaerolineales bacterium]